MSPSETSRDTLHPGTGGYVPNDFALRGAFGGWGYEGNCGFAAKKCRGAHCASEKVGSPETSSFWRGLGQSPKRR